MKFRVSGLMAVIIALSVISKDIRAQDQNPSDAAVDGIRRLNNISNLDQDSIRRWIDHETNNLTDLPKDKNSDGFNTEAFKTFLEKFEIQRTDPNNTNAFLAQLSAQLANAATQLFKQNDAVVTASRAVARAMADLRTPETIPGLLAGLSTTDRATKYLCTKALTALRSAINQNSATANQMIQVLKAVGTKETDPIVLGQMYEALNIPTDINTTLDVYFDIFDRRLAERRQQMTIVDSAELHAYEIFRQPDLLNNLNQNQKANLVQRVAVFLRTDAQRYNDPMIAPPVNPINPDLSFYERDTIERRLDAAEDILSTIVGPNKGGDLRNALSNDGFDGRAAILDEVYKWIGNAENNTRGVLNDAPWNVPVGAP